MVAGIAFPSPESLSGHPCVPEEALFTPLPAMVCLPNTSGCVVLLWFVPVTDVLAGKETTFKPQTVSTVSAPNILLSLPSIVGLRHVEE